MLNSGLLDGELFIKQNAVVMQEQTCSIKGSLLDMADDMDVDLQPQDMHALWYIFFHSGKLLTLQLPPLERVVSFFFLLLSVFRCYHTIPVPYISHTTPPEVYTLPNNYGGLPSGALHVCMQRQ